MGLDFFFVGKEIWFWLQWYQFDVVYWVWWDVQFVVGVQVGNDCVYVFGVVDDGVYWVGLDVFGVVDVVGFDD